MKYIKTYEQNVVFELDYSGQDFNYLPKLLDKLEILYCYNNNLTELPELPDTLKELDCYNNDLTELPELSKKLKELYCDNL